MKLNQIAFQLYTCRDLIKTPAELAKTLRRLRAIGYTGVEVCCTGSMTEAEINQILDDEGLVCCSTHEGSDVILETPQKVVARLQKLRCSITSYPFPGGIDFSSAESVRGLIAKLQNAGTVLRAAGLTLCYHNHNHEFRKLNGKTILDLIYDGTSHDALQAELDTYWVQNGGGDIVEWCGKLAGRLPVIHLKDYRTSSQNTPEFCEIGSGNLNFKKSSPQLKPPVASGSLWNRIRVPAIRSILWNKASAISKPIWSIKKPPAISGRRSPRDCLPCAFQLLSVFSPPAKPSIPPLPSYDKTRHSFYRSMGRPAPLRPRTPSQSHGLRRPGTRLLGRSF